MLSTDICCLVILEALFEAFMLREDPYVCCWLLFI